MELASIDDQASSISGEHIITKSNQLIRAKQKLSLQERRILYMFISMINPSDDDFRLMRLNVRDIADFIGIQRKNYYNTVKEIVVGLQKKGVYIKKDKSVLYVNWLASSEYYDNKGYVELEFSQKMKPYLLQLKKQFTQFKLKNVIKLKSEYSMQIYELLKEEQFRGKAIFYLDELRNMLGLEKNTYKQMCHFKSRIIDRAQKDLENQTDIKFTYEDIKKGRKIVGFLFHIKQNEKVIPLINYTDDDDLLGTLTSYQISKGVAKKVVESYSRDRIIKNVGYILSGKKKINNLPGAIVNAIKEDYAKSEIISDEQMINRFIDDCAPKGKHELLPEFMIKEKFFKWADKKLGHLADEKISELWSKYHEFLYNTINR